MLSNLVVEIIKSGLSEAEIATRCGCTQPTINRIKRGQESATHRIGSAIEKLHAARCSDPDAASCPPAAPEVAATDPLCSAGARP